MAKQADAPPKTPEKGMNKRPKSKNAGANTASSARRKGNLMMRQATAYELSRKLRKQEKEVTNLVETKKIEKAAKIAQERHKALRFSVFYSSNKNLSLGKKGKSKDDLLEEAKPLYRSIFEPMNSENKAPQRDPLEYRRENQPKGQQHFSSSRKLLDDEVHATRRVTDAQTSSAEDGSQLAELLRTKNPEIQAIRLMPITKVDRMRKDAEKYLIRATGIDPLSTDEYYQGPRTVQHNESIKPQFSSKVQSGEGEDCSPEDSGTQSFSAGDAPRSSISISEKDKLVQMQRNEFQNDLEMVREKLDKMEVNEGDGNKYSSEKSTTASVRRKPKHGRFGKTEFRDSEVLLQYAFVARAQVFGLNNAVTNYARQNLYRCYLAQIKQREAEEVNERPEEHLRKLEELDIHKLVQRVRARKLNELVWAKTGVASPRVSEATVIKRPGNAISPGTQVEVDHSSDVGRWTKDFKLVLEKRKVQLTQGNEVPLALVNKVEQRQGRTGNDMGQIRGDDYRERYNEIMQCASVQKPIHAQVRDLLLADDYWTAVEVSRLGLKMDKTDKVLEVFFTIATRKIACYPRWTDFRADVKLTKLGNQELLVLGEKLSVSYTYEHEQGPQRLHTLQDTIGLFKLFEDDEEEEEDCELVQWVTVPPENSGTVHFCGVPNEPGRYIVQYLVHGSTLPVGSTVMFKAEHVATTFLCPKETACGDTIRLSYCIHVDTFEHHEDDFVGIYAIEPSRVRTLLKVTESTLTAHGFEVGSLSSLANSSNSGGNPGYSLLYPPGKCLAKAKFPGGNEGTIVFKNVPKLPGLVEFRAFDSQFGESQVGASHPVSASLLRTAVVTPHERHLWREVRVFVGCTVRDFHLERKALLEYALPQLQALALARRVALTFVDLTSAIDSSDLDSGIGLATYLQEIDACRPFCVFLLGERYGWVPLAQSRKRIGQHRGHHLWLDEYQNPVVAEALGTRPDQREPRSVRQARFVPEGDGLGKGELPDQLNFSVLEMAIAYGYILPKAEIALPAALSNSTVRGAGGQVVMKAQHGTRRRGEVGNLELLHGAKKEENVRLLFRESDTNVRFQDTNNALFYERHPVLTVRDDALITKHEMSARDAALAMRNLKTRLYDSGAFMRQNLMSPKDISDYLVNDIAKQIEEMFPMESAPNGSECEMHMLLLATESWCCRIVKNFIDSPFIQNALEFFMTPKALSLPWQNVGKVSSQDQEATDGRRKDRHQGSMKESRRKELSKGQSRTNLAIDEGAGSSDPDADSEFPDPAYVYWDGFDKYATHPKQWKGTPLVIAGPEGSGRDAQLVYWMRHLKITHKPWNFRKPNESEQAPAKHAVEVVEEKITESTPTKMDSQLQQLRHNTCHAGCYFKQPENNKARAAAMVSSFGSIIHSRRTLFLLLPVGYVPGLSHDTDVIRHAMTEACCAFSLKYPIPTNPKRLREEFRNGTFIGHLERARCTLYLVVVGIDRLTLPPSLDGVASVVEHCLAWFPSNANPSVLRMVCSCTHSSEAYDSAIRRRWNIVLAGAFQEQVSEVENVLGNVLEHRPVTRMNRKALTDHLVSNMNVSMGNGKDTAPLLLPLHVSMVVDDWYVRTSPDLPSTAMAPTTEFLEVKHDLVAMYTGMIETVEQISRKLVQDVLCLIRCSPAGLQEFELLRILGIHSKAAAAVSAKPGAQEANKAGASKAPVVAQGETNAEAKKKGRAEAKEKQLAKEASKKSLGKASHNTPEGVKEPNSPKSQGQSTKPDPAPTTVSNQNSTKTLVVDVDGHDSDSDDDLEVHPDFNSSTKDQKASEQLNDSQVQGQDALENQSNATAPGQKRSRNGNRANQGKPSVKRRAERIALLWSQVFLAMKMHLLLCVNGAYVIAHPCLAKAVDKRYGIEIVTVTYEEALERQNSPFRYEQTRKLIQARREERFHLTNKYQRKILRFFASSGTQLYKPSQDHFAEVSTNASTWTKLRLFGPNAGNVMHTGKWFRKTDTVPSLLRQAILVGPRDHRRNNTLDQLLESIVDVDTFGMIVQGSMFHKFFDICAWMNLPPQDAVSRLRLGFEKYFKIHGVRSLVNGFLRYEHLFYRHFLSPSERGDPEWDSSSSTAVALDNNQLLKQLDDQARALLFRRLKVFRVRGPLALTDISLFCVQSGQFREALLFLESALFVSWQAAGWDEVLESLQGGAQKMPACYIAPSLVVLRVLVDLLVFRILNMVNYSALSASVIPRLKSKRDLGNMTRTKSRRELDMLSRTQSRRVLDSKPPTSTQVQGWLKEEFTTVFGVVPGSCLEYPMKFGNNNVEDDGSGQSSSLLDKRGKELLNKLENAYKVFESLRIRSSAAEESAIALSLTFEAVNKEIVRLDTIRRNRQGQ